MTKSCFSCGLWQETVLDVGVGLLVRLSLGGEGGVLPVAVAPLGRVVRTPACALLHHRDAVEVALDEPAVRIAFRVAVGIDLGAVDRHHEHRTVGNRPAFAHCLHDLGLRIQLAILLVVVPVDDPVALPRRPLLGELDVLRTGADGRRKGQRARPGCQCECLNPVTASLFDSLRTVARQAAGRQAGAAARGRPPGYISSTNLARLRLHRGRFYANAIGEVRDGRRRVRLGKARRAGKPSAAARRLR